MKDWNAQSTICRSAKTTARESSAVKGTSPGRSVNIFNVNRASAAAARVAARDGDGAVSSRSSTSPGARRIRGDARERVQEFEALCGLRRQTCKSTPESARKNCISHHAVGADNAAREPSNNPAQRKHPCFASRSTNIKNAKPTAGNARKRGPAVDPNNTTAPAPAPAPVLLGPLSHLPHAARRLRGPRARHDVRHVLGLRHVLLRFRVGVRRRAVDATDQFETQASANPSSRAAPAPRTPTAT